MEFRRQILFCIKVYLHTSDSYLKFIILITYLSREIKFIGIKELTSVYNSFNKTWVYKRNHYSDTHSSLNDVDSKNVKTRLKNGLLSKMWKRYGMTCTQQSKIGAHRLTYEILDYSSTSSSFYALFMTVCFCTSDHCRCTFGFCIIVLRYTV